MNASEKTVEPSRTEVWRMFDRIAPRYDLLNRLLSFRQDVIWRRRMARYIGNAPQQRLLDLATGTADQLIALMQASDKIVSAVGTDMAKEMLAFGEQKIHREKLDLRARLEVGDATEIKFADSSFDLITISFGIRNVIDVNKALQEMRRVLKPGGRVLILEFSLPKNKLFRSLYLFYFRRVLPRLGGLISGDSYAYRYLNQTVETFPYGAAFCDIMAKAGFVNPVSHPLTFGIATIYQGDKL